jgi:hypothetical protein
LERNLDRYSVGELQLPAPEMKVFAACSNSECTGQWQLTDQQMIENNAIASNKRCK